MNRLFRLDESGVGKEVAHPSPRAVVDVPLDRLHADIVDEPAPGSIAVAVDQHQPAPRLQDPVHLGHGPLLVGIVVKAVGTGYHVEAPAGEGQVLAVSLDRHEGILVRSPASRATLEHLGDKVHAIDLSIWQGFEDLLTELAGPASCIEDPDGPVAEALLNSPNQCPVRGAEEQPLKDAAIVRLAPAGELFRGLLLVVAHGRVLR